VDRGAKPVCQALEVVPGVVRRGNESRIGQQRCAGEVIGQADTGDGARFVTLEPGEIERGAEQIRLRVEGNLVQKLERLGGGGGRWYER